MATSSGSRTPWVLSLSRILQAFNAALSEEQCWSLAFQTLIALKSSNDFAFVLDLNHLFLTKDGAVHPKSLTEDSDQRIRAQNPNQLLASLGVVLFRALDFGLQDDEERSISRPLELLIESLTSCDPNDETKDEGIERDFDHSFDDVIQKCVSRLSCASEAESHYRAVCRALVAETIELTEFLGQVSCDQKEQSEHKQVLVFHDWARLWVQVIRQLREGVNLRKVATNEREARVEYELTPFEMLLDDIRLQRYKLNPIADQLKRVKKDAHELILDFIRSRPPLAPVSQRQLRDAPNIQTSLYEKLMLSIRQNQLKLRPTNRPISEQKPITEVETSRTRLSEEEVTPTPRRRLIKADLNLRLSNSFDDEEEEEICGKTSKSESQEEKRKFSLKNLSLKLLERRHSITVCESPQSLDANEDTRQHVANIWESTEWGRRLQCLSLTLQEVQHIRSVLTKAELETLAVTQELRRDLESQKICFTCLKTRFSFFGQRAHTCKVCERAICERCVTRMHIPLERFEKVPIYMLSPTPSPPNEPIAFTARAQDTPQMKALVTNEGVLVDSGLRKSGPKVRVCRDCKQLLRHLIDTGCAHSQY